MTLDEATVLCADGKLGDAAVVYNGTTAFWVVSAHPEDDEYWCVRCKPVDAGEMHLYSVYPLSIFRSSVISLGPAGT